MIPHRKAKEFEKIFDSLENFHRAFLVDCDNVGSRQLQDIRRAVRGNSTILMGKNTLMKRCLQCYFDKWHNGIDDRLVNKWHCLPNFLVGNVGLLLTQGDLNEIREILSKFRVGAPARVGAIAPCDVTVNSGATGMDPSATSFFQALNIPTKINKGTVEIIGEMVVVKTGDRVGSSEAALLSKLGIKPFSYGLLPIKVFEDGTTYDPKILDLKYEDLEAAASIAMENIAAMSLALCFPNPTAIPHLVIGGLKNVLAVATFLTYGQLE